MRLTDAQKAQNKAANAVRRKAHAQRYRLLRAAVAAAEAMPDVLQAKAAADAATERYETAWRAREDNIGRLRAQIAELERQIAAARNDQDALTARAVAEAAWDRWRKLKDAKVAEAEAAFPDLSGAARWSAAAWEPLPDVLDAMNAARSAVHDA